MGRDRSMRHPADTTPRGARRIHEERPGKLPEPVHCPRCGSSYRDGRWTWETAAADSEEHLCAACQRIEDGYPAGVVHLAGGFAAEHRSELIGLLRNLEERERAQHPLKRIMEIVDEESGFRVSTTDAKLALSFGRALESAYEGRLEQPSTSRDPDDLVRVHWTRD